MHQQQIISMLKRLKPLWEIPVSEIESNKLESILSPLAGSTRNRYMLTLSAIWNYGIKKEYTKENPLTRMDRVHLPRKSIQTFSNRVVKGMLNESLASYIEMVPFFAIGVFAGLRAGSPEMHRLLWTDIKWEDKTIVVRAELSKTKQRRFVEMSDNLIAWLQAYLNRKPNHPRRVITLSFQKLQEVRSEVFHRVAGDKAKYVQAGLRHTYASNHLAMHNDINKLVLQMGHGTNPDMLFRHYHLHTRKEDAIEFWGIIPPTS